MPTPTPIASRFDALKLYKQANTAFTEAGSYLVPDPKAWVVTLASIAQLSLHLREYAIITVDDIEPVWSKLRAIPKAADILTYAMADLTMVMAVDWETVAQGLAESIHAIVSPTGNAEHKATDVAFHESFGSLIGYVTLLQNNRWLMLLMLLRRSGAFNLANRQVESRRAEQPEAPASAPEAP